MNYLRELNAFRNLALINPFATGEVALWHSLMSVNNMTGWREWFTVPNSTLQTLTGLSRQGLDKARNRLVQRELIEYKKGRSNIAGSYKLLSVCQKVGTAVDTVVDMAVDEVVDTVGAQQLSQQRRGSGTLLNKDSTETNNDVSEYARAPHVVEAIGQIHDAYQQIFGYQMNTFQMGELLKYFEAGMELNLIFQTMKNSRLAGKDLRYTLGALKGLKEQGILTEQAATAAAKEAYPNERNPRRFSKNAGNGTTGQTESITNGKTGWINRQPDV